MENNCLVTKCLGSVQRNDLPEINTIYFDYPGGYDVTKDLALNLTIKAGATPVKIELAVAMHEDLYSGNLITEKVLAANTQVSLITKVADIGASRINKLVKISGGIYDLVKVSANGYGDQSSIDCTPTAQNSISSLKYNTSLIVFGGTNVDASMLPDNLKYLVVASETNEINIDNIPIGVQKVSSSRVNTGNPYYQIVKLTEGTKRLTGLRVVDSRLGGDIKNLPTGVKVLNVAGSQLTGAIEDFVAATGSNSGCIAFKTPASDSWFITLGGAKIYTLQIPVVNNYGYLQWNNGTYTWASSMPADMEKYITSAGNAPRYWSPIVE